MFMDNAELRATASVATAGSKTSDTLKPRLSLYPPQPCGDSIGRLQYDGQKRGDVRVDCREANTLFRPFPQNLHRAP